MNRTKLESRILDRIQTDFPLCEDPYGELAAGLGCTADEAWQSVARLRESGVIRRIGGVFASSRLGYVSCLVAAKVDPPELEAAAAVAGSHPEVTHNYERDAEYNLWFTIVAETGARLQDILDAVGRCKGVKEIHRLPATRTFKIRVKFDFGSHAGDSEPEATPPPAGAPSAANTPVLDATDRKIIQRLSGDIGASRRPFDEIAQALGLAPGEVLARLEACRQAGAIRRFGAVLRHQKAGYSSNGMSIWNVPDPQVEAAGRRMAGRSEISHCYERPRFAGWPYNLFGMIHGTSREQVLDVAAKVAAEISIADYRVLFSVREFKKSSVVFFGDE